MTKYKSPISRLVRIFKKSRDQWKERANQKQKRLRSLEIQVRDLSRSRERWKEKAKQVQQELEQLKREQAGKTEPDSQTIADSGEQTACAGVPAGHHYPIFVIQIAIEQIIHSLQSYRGCQKSFEVFGRFFCLPQPSFSCIRQWLLRVGLYELQQQPPEHTDWIIILDLTLELGQHKCLVILGVPASRLAETGFALSHHDVVVLELAVLTSCTGGVIAQTLSQLTQQIGPPLQIVSDQGSEVRKGITLYQQQYPRVIWTYDVTHQMALLLEKELASDERYQAFCHQCTQIRHQTKQTALYFLAPPAQRPKARYLNIDEQIQWAQQLLHYQAQADFSAITPHFRLDQIALSCLQSQLDPASLADLAPLQDKLYPDRHSFCCHLSQILGAERWAEYAPALLLAADLGRRLFDQKFGWLQTYQADICLYAHMMTFVHQVQAQLKHHGLSRTSKERFASQTLTAPLSPRLDRFRSSILTYLQTQAQPLTDEQTLLATSDVLESIFGKYKLFSIERAFKEIGSLVLLIPLFTVKLTAQRIKQALEKVRMIDVQEWAQQVFGSSMLSRRKAFLQAIKPI
jgi:hypothetical protein